MLACHLQRTHGKQGRVQLGKWRSVSTVAASDSLLRTQTVNENFWLRRDKGKEKTPKEEGRRNQRSFCNSNGRRVQVANAFKLQRTHHFYLWQSSEASVTG